MARKRINTEASQPEVDASLYKVNARKIEEVIAKKDMMVSEVSICGAAAHLLFYNRPIRECAINHMTHLTANIATREGLDVVLNYIDNIDSVRRGAMTDHQFHAKHEGKVK